MKYLWHEWKEEKATILNSPSASGEHSLFNMAVERV